MDLRTFITEMPIVGWNAAPDMEEREQEMISKFSGYNRDQKSYSPADKRAIAKPKKIIKAFGRVPYRFNIYFWQMNTPDYDPYLQHGVVSREWLAEHQIDFEPYYQADAINIIVTNNMSDEHKISFTSPWIFAHRVGHALEGRTGDFDQIFKRFCQKLIPLAYGVDWPQDDYYMSVEYNEIYTKVMGHKLGTMKAARDGHLVSGAEWAMETFAQYLMTGWINLNPLPERLSDDEILTTNSRNLAKVNRMMDEFPKTVVKNFDRTLRRSVGKILVV